MITQFVMALHLWDDMGLVPLSYRPRTETSPLKNNHRSQALLSREAPRCTASNDLLLLSFGHDAKEALPYIVS
jgi:hypothetical protein